MLKGNVEHVSFTAQSKNNFDICRLCILLHVLYTNSELQKGPNWMMSRNNFVNL